MTERVKKNRYSRILS